MPAVAHVLTLSRLAENDAAWRLMRADQAPVLAGLLGAHLGGDERRLDAEELYERLDDDLERLRAQGVELPLGAKGYCAAWRAAGFLVRRPAVDMRGETLELSPDAIAAIRFIQGRAAPRSTVTESRLSSLATQVRQLAIDTDPDVSTRVALLEEERDRIDAQIEALHSGEDWTLAPERALERVRDLLDQASHVPDDFAQVRAEFERLNAALRVQIIESEASQAAVVDEIFRGIDHIADSDAGRSFAAFSQLVLDPALGAEFEANIHRVLSRAFAQELEAGDRRNLRSFLRTLKSRSAEIHDVITAFARALRRYVQSQDYQHDRVLRDSLRSAQHAGIEAARHIRPWAPTELRLDLSSLAVASIGEIALEDPAELAATEEIISHEVEHASLEELRAIARETEIDFAELTANVNTVLSDLPTCTVGEVLTRFPATQGVGSVVGLLMLAAAQGTREDTYEDVTWTGVDAITRSAILPTHRFTGAVT